MKVALVARGKRLPADSRRYAELAFKEKWHRRRERMSFTRKIEVLDRLWKARKELPKLGDGQPPPDLADQPKH